MEEEQGILKTIEDRIEQARLNLVFAGLQAEYEYWDLQGKILRGEVPIDWNDLENRN